MTSTMTHSEARPLQRARASATVLVATDGTEQSDGALRIAIARATEMGANLEVLAVATPDPIMAPDATPALWAEANLLRRVALRGAAEEQLTRVTERERSYPVLLLDGNPAHTIARAAVEQRAALIVVGLGRHKVVDRLFSDETALQLARISRVPVLAVPSTATEAPRHAVVAVDFSELSTRAAQAAIETVGDAGLVELVHIMPYVQPDSFTLEIEEPYERWVGEQLASLVLQLVAPRGVTIVSTAIRGRPAPELLAYATKVGADLIATGTHGRGFVARTLLGSVTSQLLRAATCSLLTVPRDPLPALAVQHDTLGLLATQGDGHWASVLATFTGRNTGRRTILEVDDLELGAQAQEYNYPLIATMYDAREHRVQIMLGESGTRGRHLTRSIGGVVAVDVLTDGTGRDVALRIGHGTSQTLLTFAT